MTHLSITQGLVGMFATLLIGWWSGWKMRGAWAWVEEKRRENEE